MAEGNGVTPSAWRQRERIHVPGLVYSALGASLWGLSGVAAQSLFRHHQVSPQWLVTIRMLGGGGALYLWLRPPLPRVNAVHFVVFAVGGLAAVQYTYLVAVETSNAATATFLQNLFVPMTALFEVVVGGKRLTGSLIVALPMAVCGLCLLVVAGQPEHVAVRLTSLGLLFGLLSAVAAAGYTLMSVALVPHHGAWPVTTWGLLIGGAVSAVWAPPWAVHVTGDALLVVGLTLFIVLGGTAAAFGLYLTGLRWMTATEGALTATVEPLVAALASLIFLGSVLYPGQYLGGAIILVAITFLRGTPDTPSPRSGGRRRT